MDFFKTLPIAYTGQLHNVRLINFSVDPLEVKPFVPAGMHLREFEGRAVISMADLEIRSIRPTFLPSRLSLSYRHIAFRLLLNDFQWVDGHARGFCFLKSFCNERCLACGGAVFTDYALTQAVIKGQHEFSLIQDDRSLCYSLGEETKENPDEWKEISANLTCAYACHSGRLWQTHIRPGQWPLKGLSCSGFRTNFFESAQFLNAFEVTRPLNFYRSAPRVVASFSLQGRECPVFPDTSRFPL